MSDGWFEEERVGCPNSEAKGATNRAIRRLLVSWSWKKGEMSFMVEIGCKAPL